MRKAVSALLEATCGGRPLACCRILETGGSTPRKAGTWMLVFLDGTQAGTLGGGAPEAEIKARALHALSRNAAEIGQFQLDEEQADEAICGGWMRVLIQPVRDREAADYYRRFAELIQHNGSAVEAIVFDAQASGLPAPASYLLDSQSRLVATLHAGSPADVPAALRQRLPLLADAPRPLAASGVAYLPTVSRRRLIIVGGGHIGKAVADLAGELDFDVWVVDDRPEFVDQERFPRAERRLCGDVNAVLPGVDVSPETYCLIATRGHRHDEDALFHLAERGAAYVGMIGSREIGLVFERLLRRGVSRESLRQVYAPIGIEIGSQTPPEIAVSICAELIAHRNCGGQVPWRLERSVPETLWPGDPPPPR